MHAGIVLGVAAGHAGTLTNIVVEVIRVTLLISPVMRLASRTEGGPYQGKGSPIKEWDARQGKTRIGDACVGDSLGSPFP